ncbi:MAG: GxxExxY protein [Lentisphaeraceae bacterium]|nr:GxxExxY protein [Lentisphaeraceae bacterium]
MDENSLATEVVDAAFVVHSTLGPGLLEHVYEIALAHELRKRGFACERQVPIQIEYDGIKFDEGFKADIIVAGLVIVELKSVKDLTDVHKKQVATYLKLTGKKLGLLINFNESLIKHGLKRIVNNL